jgi:hypothetical protein
MEPVVTPNAAAYRLLYVQPEPASDERICVGLLLVAERSTTVTLDSGLKKLDCLGKSEEAELLRFYLRALKREVESSRGDLDVLLAGYGPAVSVSAPRPLLSPLTEAVRDRLIDQFVRVPDSIKQAVGERAETKERLVSFARSIAGSLGQSIVLEARPIDVLGHRMPSIKPVAAALMTSDAAVLIDGVDLTAGSPARGVKDTNKVVHTFWQYGRLRQPDAVRSLRRVAVILNGVDAVKPAERAKYKEAHDYAVDMLLKESDVLVQDEADRDELVHLLREAHRRLPPPGSGSRS